MAQIVTITNPLTGQPAQVDQLDHTAQEIDDAIARAIPGGAIDTALQNKAPGGFGLGTISQTVTDFDTVKLNGWYFGAIGTAHAPDSVNEWSVRVTNLAHNSEVCVQDAYALTNVNKYLHRRRLVYIGTAVQDNPWEWVNPPMELGVEEYRTTERYLGKPVYVKMIEAGFNPAGTVKETSDTTVSASGLVRFSAVRGAWSLPSFMYGGNYEDAGDIQVSVQATSDGIHVLTWSKTRDMTSATAMVSVYYTKD